MNLLAKTIAILAVLITHYFAFSMIGPTWTGLGKLVQQITIAGWLGVDLFFVLSGFLITRILLGAKARPHFFRNFYARRALRILPLYFVVLALIWICYSNSGPFVLLGLLMSANLAPIFHIAVVSAGRPLWSLAVEEHFYLLWPIAVKFARTKTIFFIACLVCVVEPAFRAAARFMVDDVYFYSWFRFDGLAWGAIVAVLITEGRPGRRAALRLAAAATGVALLAIAIGTPYGILHRGNRLGAALQFPFFQIIFASCLLTAILMSGSRMTAILRILPLTLLGDLSYCLYLIHIPVVDLLDLVFAQFMDLHSQMSKFAFISLRAAIALAIALIIAALSKKFLERPVLRLKRYFP